MAEYMVVIGLVTGAIVFAALPLFKAPRILPEPSSDWKLRELAGEKENAYEAIQELEFDRQMGKLSPEDYAALKAQYGLEAVTCLKAMDALAGRLSKTEAETDEKPPVEPQKAQTRGVRSYQDGALFCPGCGHARSSEERFCPRCGNKLCDPTEGGRESGAPV